MTSISLDVDTSSQGDCTIRRDNHLGGFTVAQEKAEIATLLADAVYRTCQAFGIAPVGVTSRIEALGNEATRDPLAHHPYVRGGPNAGVCGDCDRTRLHDIHIEDVASG